MPSSTTVFQRMLKYDVKSRKKIKNCFVTIEKWTFLRLSRNEFRQFPTSSTLPNRRPPCFATAISDREETTKRFPRSQRNNFATYKAFCPICSSAKSAASRVECCVECFRATWRRGLPVLGENNQIFDIDDNNKLPAKRIDFASVKTNILLSSSM